MSPALSIPVAAATATKVCRGPCGRELPATPDYFKRYSAKASRGAGGLLEGTCKRCRDERGKALSREKTALSQAVKASQPGGRWTPRVVGEGGPEGGFTEYATEGYRFVCLPDSHGYRIDWQAAEAALAFVRYYKPVVIYLLGDHVDFGALSRFVKSPEEAYSLDADVAEAQRFLAKVRESAPNARIVYLKGNHEARMQKYLWSRAAELHKVRGLDVPNYLELGNWNIEWEESGATWANPALMIKHGHVVRLKAGYTATGELERNGISGISGHSHRASHIPRRTAVGLLGWIESGCLCDLNPSYMEGQTADWQHAVSFGSIDLTGTGFSAGFALIHNGRVRLPGREVGP